MAIAFDFRPICIPNRCSSSICNPLRLTHSQLHTFHVSCIRCKRWVNKISFEHRLILVEIVECKKSDRTRASLKKKNENGRPNANQTSWRKFGTFFFYVLCLTFGKYDFVLKFTSRKIPKFILFCSPFSSDAVWIHSTSNTYTNTHKHSTSASHTCSCLSIRFSHLLRCVGLADKPHTHTSNGERRFDSNRIAHQTLSLGCTFRQFTNRITWKINIFYLMKTEKRQSEAEGVGERKRSAASAQKFKFRLLFFPSVVCFSSRSKVKRTHWYTRFRRCAANIVGSFFISTPRHLCLPFVFIPFFAVASATSFLSF